MSLSEKQGGKSHLGTILLSAVSGIWRFCMVIRSLLPISMETTHNPKEPVFLIAFKIMRHVIANFKVRPFSVCSSDTLLACALASVGQLLRLWFFQGGFSVLGRSFPFPSLLGFFPSFCQALAEDRVTTPTKKKKKLLFWSKSKMPPQPKMR